MGLGIAILSLSFILMIEIGLRVSKVYQTIQEANGVGYFSIYETFGRKHYWTRPANTEITVDYLEFKYSFVTNSLGIRDSERNIEHEGCIRILLLGDSFIESFGTEGDSTVAVLMQDVLSKKYAPQCIEVMNGAVAGSDLFFNYLLLEGKLLDYTPDIVLLNINSTDIMDYCVKGGLNRVGSGGELTYRPCPINNSVYQYLHLYRFWVHGVLQRDLNTYLTKKEQEAYIGQFANSVNGVLLQLDSLAKAQSFKYQVILQPLPNEVENRMYNNGFDGIQSKHLVNLMDSFLSVNPTSKIFWPIDGHFTPYGNKLYVKFVTNHMLAQNLITAN